MSLSDTACATVLMLSRPSTPISQVPPRGVFQSRALTIKNDSELLATPGHVPLTDPLQ